MEITSIRGFLFFKSRENIGRRGVELVGIFPEKVIKSQGRAVLELSFNRGLSGGVQGIRHLILYYAWVMAESKRKTSLG